MSKRKICVVTGCRADYGILYLLIKGIKDDSELELQIIATGMHLSPEFGLTWRIIEEDGFRIDAKVEMLLSSDTSVGVAKSIGLGVIGCADALDRLQPDILLLLGDRFEMLAAAQSALVMRIPIAHIAGGDTTEGAFDEAIRHSITKMAHLHFVTNEESARRVCQLGENSSHVYNVGSPGIDQIKKLKLLSREEIEKRLDFRFRERNLLVTFHPVTLDIQPASVQFQELLSALDTFGEETGLILTKPNADTEGRVICSMIDDYENSRPNAKAYTSLGQLCYLSCIAQVDAIVGNSSSGLYEVPSFSKPTVNIGNRQKGRLNAFSVINCEPESGAIARAIRNAFVKDCSNTLNPYGDGNSSSRIIEILKMTGDYRSLLKKSFYS